MVAVVTGDFNIFWSRSGQVVELRLDVRDSFPSVELITGLLEVVLHQVNVLVVVFFVNTRVSDHTDAEQMETLCHSLAFQKCFGSKVYLCCWWQSLGTGKVASYVDNREL